jgi:hypothetical protein
MANSKLPNAHLDTYGDLKRMVQRAEDNIAASKFSTNAHRDTYGDLKRAAQRAEDNIAADLNRSSLMGTKDVDALQAVAHAPTVAVEAKKQRALEDLKRTPGIIMGSPKPLAP